MKLEKRVKKVSRRLSCFAARALEKKFRNRKQPEVKDGQSAD